MHNGKKWYKLCLLCLTAVILVVLPHYLNVMWLSISIITLWMMYLCTIWNICGMGGIFALSHGLALVGGAYISTILWRAFGLSPWIGMLAAAVFVGFLSLIISYLGFRSRMTVLTFGLFTLIWGAIGEFVLATIRPFGSTEVISNFYSGTNLLLYQFESPIAFYYIILLFCVGAILLSKYIINSKFGVYLVAIRGNERLAASVGINVMRYRTIAVVSSMMLWTFAGTFWAQYNRAASAELVAIEPLLFTILIVAFGGMGTLWGPILGAGILIPIREMLRIKFVTLPGLSIVLFGLIIAVILLILRDGIVPRYTEYVRKKRSMVKKIEAQV